jgi:hypothetical protein
MSSATPAAISGIAAINAARGPHRGSACAPTEYHATSAVMNASNDSCPPLRIHGHSTAAPASAQKSTATGKRRRHPSGRIMSSAPAVCTPRGPWKCGELSGSPQMSFSASAASTAGIATSAIRVPNPISRSHRFMARPYPYRAPRAIVPRADPAAVSSHGMRAKIERCSDDRTTTAT